MGKSNKKSGSTKKYSDQQLMCAIQAVKDGMSQTVAAKKYGIPKSTLYVKVSGKSEIGKKAGKCTVLSTGEESVIAKWVLSLAKIGFPVRKRQLLQSVQLYLNAQKRKTLFPNNYPGINWYKNFLNRHPIISERKSQNLTPNRAAVTEDQIKRWHAEVYKYCEDNNLMEALNDPNRIFNMDEKGFILTPKNEVVLTKKGDRAAYKRSQNDEKECVTALLGGNASGLRTPPMIVYAYKRMPSTIQLHMPAKWTVGISDNGWQTQETFYDYITKVFYKWLLEQKIKLPVILFIDGHKSHISLNLSDFCVAHQIELVALYPNSTHLIQPMDVGVLSPVNASWGKRLEDWKLIHNYAKIQKTDVASILNDAINAIDYASCLKKGFKKSGLFPFIVDNINFSRILPNTGVAAASLEELWTVTKSSGPNAVQMSLENKKEEEPLNRLKHFEGMIDDVILHLFKFSNDKWSGPKEYEALYHIWKKLHKEASNSSVMTMDTDSFQTSINAQDQIGTSTKEIGQCSMLAGNNLIWKVEDDVQLMDSEEIGSMIVEYDEIGNCEPIDMSIDEQCIVIETPHYEDIIEPTARSNGNEDDNLIVKNLEITNYRPIEWTIDDLCNAVKMPHSVTIMDPREASKANEVGSMSLDVSVEESSNNLSTSKEKQFNFANKTFDVVTVDY